jgi:phage terminase large subunit
LLLQRGYTGFKAKKDINAGISYVKGFDIIVDSQGEFAEDAMNEVKSFAWQTDPDDSSKFIEKPEEGNDHFCDTIRYGIVTEHMYNRNYGVASFDFDSVEDKLRKGGIFIPTQEEKQYYKF